ncbi:hypothetical protein [Streptomyces sp. AK02-01A]|uniref:hypothetical protein n=1 Tax=Streptomyces sp. AK02-01A TaxID=3028648 RepID=UPI0029A70CDF|nr:hypothetical protein [Streptomyces sp. AK02-01A]MDX3853821.1 hypothetical protein [Streptomyces sp. AK02-01A]
MSTATFPPSHARQSPPLPGATATGAIPHPAHHLGNALRAVKIFVSAAFQVSILGEYAEEAGVKRR